MNFSYFKFMIYINKHSPIHWLDLTSAFGITKTEAKETVNYLSANKYISPVGDTKYRSTYKGKHFIKSIFLDWIFNNLLAIIAIVISIIALFK